MDTEEGGGGMVERGGGQVTMMLRHHLMPGRDPAYTSTYSRIHINRGE